MNNDTKLAILTNKLRLPSPNQLSPWLRRLLENPDSIVIIAIEKPLGHDGPHIGTTWLGSKERLQMRKALERINADRQKKGEQQTSEMPAAIHNGNR